MHKKADFNSIRGYGHFNNVKRQKKMFNINIIFLSLECATLSFTYKSIISPTKYFNVR